MNVAFRCDASLAIGNGHAMRCLTLAQALRAAGARCSFIGREAPGHLLGSVRAQGFDTRGLPADSPLDGSDEAQALDARQTLAALGDQVADWLVVDHYPLDARWEQTLRPACRQLMVIDDLANRPHDADLLLDQNLGRQADHYTAHLPPQARVLAGPAWALLRPEFAAARADSLARRRHQPLRQLLISMGGVDADNATGTVLRALNAIDPPPDLRIKVVMGPSAPWLMTVQQQAQALRQPTEVLLDPPDMADLMAHSDLAIGACGSTSWERCCLGLPSLVMVLADNQREVAQALARQGAVRLLAGGDGLAPALQQALAALGDPATLQVMQDAASQLIDGLGAPRVAAVMVAGRG